MNSHYFTAQTLPVWRRLMQTNASAPILDFLFSLWKQVWSGDVADMNAAWHRVLTHLIHFYSGDDRAVAVKVVQLFIAMNDTPAVSDASFVDSQGRLISVTIRGGYTGKGVWS